MKKFAATSMIVAVLLIISVIACGAATVEIKLDGKQPSEEVGKQLIDETTKLFVKNGYQVVESGADYTIKTSISALDSDKKFSPLGCLACGIWGAAKPRAKATVASSVLDSNGASVFVNSVTASSEDSEIFGLFKSTKHAKSKAIVDCLNQLYSAFFIQQK